MRARRKSRKGIEHEAGQGPGSDEQFSRIFSILKTSRKTLHLDIPSRFFRDSPRAKSTSNVFPPSFPRSPPF